MSGMSGTPNKRFFENVYQNSIDETRTFGKRGNSLPNARFISKYLFSENNEHDQRVTHLTAFFGQFLAHDITNVPTISNLLLILYSFICTNK